MFGRAKVVTKPIDREDAVDKEVVKLDRCRIDMIHPRLHPTSYRT